MARIDRAPLSATVPAALQESSPMRLAILAAALLATTAVAVAETPPDAMEPAGQWHQMAREIYSRVIAMPTVQGRGQTLAMANYLQEQFRAGGFTDITIHQYDVVRPTDRAATLIL